MRNGSLLSPCCRLAKVVPEETQESSSMPCSGSPARARRGETCPSDWAHGVLVYQRYAYWCKKGHFERIFQAVQLPDLEELMVDSTCCRAHQASAGAQKKAARRLSV